MKIFKIITFRICSKSRLYRHDNIIRLGSKSGIKILIHKTGHNIEFSNAGVRKAAQDFLARRTEGEKAGKLADLFSKAGYNPKEICKLDKLFSPYVGRIYDDGLTEVVSMGIGELYENPEGFLKADPEMFEFILEVLKGKYST